ncbi:acyl-CoA dehydrogenase family protein [Desulfoscipio sp. XC116]|uniref:acyl-CoA dehydrogenase family protein n=1 Tax=Desulfoscipio sp. XC116 TaxID=3144975 RepID=UPI00325A52CB
MTLYGFPNSYNFDDFLKRRDSYDYYRDDVFLQRLVRKYVGDEWGELHRELLVFSSKVSFTWRNMADYMARPEVHPKMLHYDAHNHRIDRIIRPMETSVLEKEIFSEGLFSVGTTPWESFIKRFLLHQNGEFGIMCPLACTEGLIALIEHYPDHGIPELGKILQHCKEGIDGEFAIGAQFMSEIQGGSDIPANLLAAVPDGDNYKLYGNKFFCSAMHADYAVVTAKVTGNEKVGTFIVPAWLPGDKEKEHRNDYTINRIKWKMGTCELPTAEVDYNGAVAYPIGPIDKGVANAVGIVLTLSRIAVGISSGAAMLRAAREAKMYSEFRDVFGSKINKFPLAARQIRDMMNTSQRTIAGAFKLYDMYIKLGRKLVPGLKTNEPLNVLKQRFILRELILMQKITASCEAVDVLRKAMSVFGGHGVMEEFSSLPRLFRDAIVNELWEGPRNVLLTQIYRDLQRASAWFDPKAFVVEALMEAPKDTVNELSEQLQRLMNAPVLSGSDADSLEAAGEWEAFCDDFFGTYQQQALAEVIE